MSDSIQVLAPAGFGLCPNGVKGDPITPPQTPAAAFGGATLHAAITPLANAQYGPVPQAHWLNIPAEMRALPQWFCWRYDEAGKKPPYNPRTGKQCDHTDPANWCSFSDACAAVALGYSGIGFSVTADNGLVLIDLDDKDTDPATPDELALFTEIYTSFGTYTERSVGGRGIHIICAGKLPEGIDGRKIGHIEIYAARHYFTFSGNMNLEGLQFIPEVYSPIMSVNGCQHEINGLVNKLGLGEALCSPQVEDIAQWRTCNEVLNAIDDAENRDRIINLYQGRSQKGYPSQSEADLALVQDLMFYGATNEQVKHLWLGSALSPAKRTGKKKHPSYIVRTINSGRSIWWRAENQRLERQAEAQLKADALFAKLANDPAFQKRVALNARMKIADEKAAARYLAKQR